MFWKGKKLLRRHRVILWITLIAVAALGFSTYLTNSYAGRQIKTHYLQAFEKKYWAELDIYHAGSREVARSYFKTTFTAVTNLSRQDHIIKAVETDNVTALETYISQARKVTGVIELLFVLDKNGVMIAESSEDGSLKQYLGSTFADRDYYKEVVETKVPAASKVFLTKNGYYGYNFCSPSLVSGEIIAIICGGGRLAGLAERLKIADINSDYATFRAVITDTDGNIIFEDGDPIAKPVNINSDRAVAALKSGAENFRDEEIDYKDAETFVEATRIDLGTDGAIFVLSYLPKSEITDELERLDRTLARINTGNGFRSLLLTLLSCAVIYWVIRKHDEETTDH